MIARINAGFTSEFHHSAWLKKHRAAIRALPLEERSAVLLAHENATHVAFSKPVRQ